MASLAVIAIFAGLSAVAIGFVVRPVLRGSDGALSRRLLLAGALGVIVLGIASGLYIAIGRPALALRSLERPEQQDMGGLIALLVTRVHQNPNDVSSWVWLGRAYETVGDPDDGARALERAVSAARGRRVLSPALLSAYAEALVRGTRGEVTPEAESAFQAVLAANPKDAAARYFLGFARAARGDKAGAAALWSSLLADVPQNTTLHQDLSDRIAALSATTEGVPNVRRMVEGLASRLEKQPDDLEGWQRLIRSWMVLGERAKAEAALARARLVFARRPDALRALEKEASASKLR
jgi:cytochrome c-type biogenesis protein CcmH